MSGISKTHYFKHPFLSTAISSPTAIYPRGIRKEGGSRRDSSQSFLFCCGTGGRGKEITRKAFQTVLSSEALSPGYQFTVSGCGITFAAQATGLFQKAVHSSLAPPGSPISGSGRRKRREGPEFKGRPAQLALLLHRRQVTCSRNLG